MHEILNLQRASLLEDMLFSATTKYEPTTGSDFRVVASDENQFKILAYCKAMLT